MCFGPLVCVTVLSAVVGENMRELPRQPKKITPRVVNVCPLNKPCDGSPQCCVDIDRTPVTLILIFLEEPKHRIRPIQSPPDSIFLFFSFFFSCFLKTSKFSPPNCHIPGLFFMAVILHYSMYDMVFCLKHCRVLGVYRTQRHLQ